MWLQASRGLLLAGGGGMQPQQLLGLVGTEAQHAAQADNGVLFVFLTRRDYSYICIAILVTNAGMGGGLFAPMPSKL